MMKTAAILFLLCPGVALAQTSPAQGPLVIERVHNPFVVAPDYKVTDLDGEFGQLAGVYAGRSIEDTLFIGGAGYWLVNGSGGDKLAYGGLLAGWSMPVGSRIRFGARSLVGLGRATLGTDFDELRRLDGQRGLNDGRVTRFGAGGFWDQATAGAANRAATSQVEQRTRRAFMGGWSPVSQRC